MKFGFRYQLTYKIGVKNKKDKHPDIILIQETEQKIIGINLNYYRILEKETILELFNQEMFKRFSFDNEILMEALNRQKEIDFNKLARFYISRNAKNIEIMGRMAVKIEKVNPKIKSISARTLYKLLDYGFRIYKKEELDLKKSQIL